VEFRFAVLAQRRQRLQVGHRHGHDDELLRPHHIEQTLRDLEYLTFASQPMDPEDQPAAAS